MSRLVYDTLADRRGNGSSGDYRYRQQVVPQAFGEIVEIGIGPGHNLPFYSNDARVVHGIDPSPELLERALRRMASCGVQVELRQAQAEQFPFDDATMNCAVSTFTLCSVVSAERALTEIRRVLRLGGRLLFAEHGLAPHASVQRTQRRYRRIWSAVAGGCILDRPIEQLIREAGFEISNLVQGYARGPRVLSYVYAGDAIAL
jgi:ubiquinone/menaquinone biosynthesis C-methylase UbiE